jgi:hypothetical protein
LTEPTHSDVWLCRLEGDDGSRLRTVSTMFRVDVRAARQILAQLPRLVARDLPSSDARRLAVRLREVGGVALVCGSGDTPDFTAAGAPVRARTTAVEAEADAASGEAPIAAADDVAPVEGRPERPTRAGKRRRSGAQRSLADEQAVVAARSAQDAAMAHWPHDATPCAWEASSATPPIVPRPVRHSAARVAWTLVIVLSVTGGAGGAFWMRFGRDVLAVSIAEPHVAPVRHVQEPAGDLPPSRFALAQELAAAAGNESFRSLVPKVAAALDGEGEPLRIENQLVGVGFEVHEHQLQAQLDALDPEVRGASACLFRHVKGSRTGFDRLVLLPTTDLATIVRVIGTSGSGLGNEDVVKWLAALHSARAVRLLGAGERFVEGRYEVSTPDGGELSGAGFTCPGGAIAAAAAGGLVSSLKGARRGDRFSCEWPP